MSMRSGNQGRLPLTSASQYQNIFGPLMKLEADYDKSMKESQVGAGSGARMPAGFRGVVLLLPSFCILGCPLPRRACHPSC